MDKKLLSSSEFYRRRYQNFATLSVIPIALLVIYLIVFSMYATKEIVVTSTGELTPASNVTSIQSISDNAITTNNLRNNKTVKKGDTLLKYEKTKLDSQTQLYLEETGQAIQEEKAPEVKATQDGILHLEKDYSGQKAIPNGTTIGEIYPNLQKEKAINLTYYVNSNYIASIKTGQLARVSLKGDNNKNLLLKGKVIAIDKTATTTKEGNVFKVRARIDLEKQEKKNLKFGLQGKVTSIVARKTYFDYYKEKLLASFN